MSMGQIGFRDVLTSAAPVEWPSGSKAAAFIGFDIDAESAVLSLDAGHAARLSVMSHQAYGPVTGLPRILSMLERQGVHATFFCPGYTAIRYPNLVRQVMDAGHEIAHHGFMHESTQGMERDDEAAVLARGIEALERITGRRPRGYRAPMWEMSYETPGLLMEQGFLYDSSLMDCDVPYKLGDPMRRKECDLVEIPVSWSLDDWEQYAYLPDTFGSGVIEDPAKCFSMWNSELLESYNVGCCFSITAHPFLSGRLSRLAMLEKLIEVMKSLPGLWIATGEEIALHVSSLELGRRYFEKPVVDV